MRQTERSKSENTCQEIQELSKNARNVNVGQQEAINNTLQNLAIAHTAFSRR